MNPLTRVAVLCACANALYNPLAPPHPPAVILTPLATDCKYGVSSVAEVTVSVAALTLDAVSLKIRFPHDGGAFPCWLSSSDNYSQPHCGKLDGTFATITWLCKTNGTQVNPVDDYDYTPLYNPDGSPNGMVLTPSAHSCPHGVLGLAALAAAANALRGTTNYRAVRYLGRYRGRPVICVFTLEQGHRFGSRLCGRAARRFPDAPWVCEGWEQSVRAIVAAREEEMRQRKLDVEEAARQVESDFREYLNTQLEEPDPFMNTYLDMDEEELHDFLYVNEKGKVGDDCQRAFDLCRIAALD